MTSEQMLEKALELMDMRDNVPLARRMHQEHMATLWEIGSYLKESLEALNEPIIPEDVEVER